MPKGIPLTKEELEEKRYEIAHKAADLIIERGFNETSVSQIAKAVGIGKSTLYDYFSNKDEIFLYLLDEPIEELTRQVKSIIAGKGSALERLYEVMYMHLEVLLRNKAYLLKLTFEAQRLDAEGQQHYQEKRYAYQDLLRALIEEGIEEGCYRPVDSAIVMKMLMAMMSTVAFTTRPVGSSKEMLGSTLDMLLRGIQK
jgi:AcrR family transcriptional regulator